MRKKNSIVLLVMLCLCVIVSGCAGVVTLDGRGPTSLEDTTLTGQYSTMQLKLPKVKENDRADILGLIIWKPNPGQARLEIRKSR